MDLEKQILLEHSKANADFIVSYINTDPEKFKALMQLFFTGSYRLVQRTSWVMSISATKHPFLIIPYLDKLIKNLDNKNNHIAVKRNSLRILEKLDVPSIYHGSLINLCFEFLADKKEALAVKVYAMEILYRLTKNEPDLQKELKILIEDQMPYGLPGFKSRGVKILNALV